MSNGWFFIVDTTPLFISSAAKLSSTDQQPLSPLRHESAIVRAWLRARDDPASPQVIGLLAQKLRADSRGLSVGGMSTIDAQALTAILASPTFVPARAKHQRGGHRGRLPNQPGRGHNR